MLAEASSKLTSPHHGRGSILEYITKNGFVADWLFYDFIGPEMAARAIATISRLDLLGSEKLCHRNIQRIREKYFQWGRSATTSQIADQQNVTGRFEIMVLVCATKK